MATAFEDNEDMRPRAAVGHIPSTGHRTVATIWAQQAAASKRNREQAAHRKAMGYGFDPDSLKGRG